jgi:hypothetical protein
MTAPEARTMWLTAGMMNALNGEVAVGGCTVRKAGMEVGREERRGKESETTADATPSAAMKKKNVHDSRGTKGCKRTRGEQERKESSGGEMELRLEA